MAQIIGFIVLCNMGGPMPAKLVAAGQTVLGFDLEPASLETALARSLAVAGAAGEPVECEEIVITILKSEQQVGAVAT
ncbi:NAD(P)-binding domain-containing protein [Methylobacterium sp. E-005]|uniref:NAD(P)-binding domain-containing protein n=1 Tax=Methylobacterium sp. E-005 TaxID=2836549 RepID=UPI001FBC05F1|nr:NAD(P)-binding domain-containing protein [Methylobacterium sp. E-005]MCJ2087874.1 NAD(P)-binding domain-containing protein [Methylobacterium sp. E-005]